MLATNVGSDIGETLGGIKSSEAESKQKCFEIFQACMDDVHYSRINGIENTKVLIKIANAINICKPDSVYVNTGSKEDREFIKTLALKNQEEGALSINDHTIHYDLAEEQGRIVDRTFYIADLGDHVSSLANKMERAKASEEID
ncbi:MAG: phosphoenolpyruvate carboxykinase, partial [Desulfobacteraceae bacterium]|nr:phosphoenolpyruvate carboxykinase [Desulfobacteraceae bacterium]